MFNDSYKFGWYLVAFEGVGEALSVDFVEGFFPVQEYYAEWCSCFFGFVHDSSYGVDGLDGAASFAKSVLGGLELFFYAFLESCADDLGHDFVA